MLYTSIKGLKNDEGVNGKQQQDVYWKMDSRDIKEVDTTVPG